MNPSSFSTALPGVDPDEDAASEAAVSKPSTPTLDKKSPSPSVKAQEDAASLATHQSNRGLFLKNDKTESSKLLPPRSPQTSLLQIPKRNLSPAAISMESYLQQFHAVQWIALQHAGLHEQPILGTDTKPKGTPVISIPDARPLDYDQKVQLYLDKLYKHITTTSSITRNMLSTPPLKSLAEVEQALANMIRGELDEEAVLQAKQDLLAASKAIFQIFLPLNHGGTICSKYWGAMHRVITVS